MESTWKSLSDVSAELNVSHETARRAALQGKIPAFQPFGKGTAWCVSPDYENFLVKSRKPVTSNGTGRTGTNSEKVALWIHKNA